MFLLRGGGGMVSVVVVAVVVVAVAVVVVVVMLFFSPVVTKPQQSRSRVGICRPSWGVLLVFAAAVRLPRDGTDPERTPAEVADPKRTPAEGHEKCQVPGIHITMKSRPVVCPLAPNIDPLGRGAGDTEIA